MIAISEANQATIFAKYHLLRQIGKGGFGVVYEARGPLSDAPLAVKLLRETPFIPKGYIEKMIANTIAVSSRCAKLNVVSLIANGREGDQFYMVSKYYKNGSLESLLASGTASFQDKICLLISMANTLYEVHCKGIVHGDIKPANFLLSDENIPMLSDFYFDLNRNSSSGLPKGTIEFMSPEQAQGKLFSYHSDIYSLGVLAYVMFTGRSPFESSSGIRDLISNKINGTFPEPLSLNDKIGKKLNKLILKAMAPIPQERFRDMKEFSKELSICKLYE